MAKICQPSDFINMKIDSSSTLFCTGNESWWLAGFKLFDRLTEVQKHKHDNQKESSKIADSFRVQVAEKALTNE